MSSFDAAKTYFSTIHCVGKTEAADVLGPLNTESEEENRLGNEVPAINTSEEFFSCAPVRKISEFEHFKDAKGRFDPLEPDVRTMTIIKSNGKAEITTSI